MFSNYLSCYTVYLILKVRLEIFVQADKLINFETDNIKIGKMSSKSLQDLSAIKNILHTRGKQYVILIHVNPDGDAIGSSLALHNLLQKAGHHPTCYLAQAWSKARSRGLR